MVSERTHLNVKRIFKYAYLLKGVTFRNLNLSPFCAIFSNNGGKLNFQNVISLSLSRKAYLPKKNHS